MKFGENFGLVVVGFLSHEIAILTLCVDKNLEMIRHANKRCESLKNAEFSVANAEDLPFPEESFDAACCTQVLLYVNNVDQALLEIKR